MEGENIMIQRLEVLSTTSMYSNVENQYLV